ncbi:MAG TPA: hypothetical protein VFQ60_04335 [Patescibacteria group bacterium]|nr:hypothetical protein [Patescibacteria group bacterium]
MFVTTHAAIGALVAEQFPDHPFLAFALGIASHFLSDMIPHGDGNLYKGYVAGSKVKRAIAYVVIDSVIAILLVLFLFNTKVFENRLGISMGIAGGVLPDLLVAIYEVTKIRFLKWVHRVHFFFHNLIIDRVGDLTFSSGFAMQIFFFAALISRIA